MSTAELNAVAGEWIDACAAGDIDEEDVLRFDHGGRTFAIYRTTDDRYFATDGLCTHEQAHLAERPRDGHDHRMPEAQRPLRLSAPARRRARRSAST